MAAPKRNKNHLVHGGTGTRLYFIWKSMRQRCNNPKNKKFPNYGLRGIKICDEWNDFVTFKKWALTHGYEDHLTLDRKDNDGNYEPSNCRWSTADTQANNRTNNRFIEFNGECHTLGEWSKITGISLRIIWQRLNRGWTVEKTLTTPTKNTETSNFD